MKHCIFALTLFLLLPRAQAEEAFVIEGGIGTAETQMFNPQGQAMTANGNAAYARLHFPLIQGARQILALTFGANIGETGYTDSTLNRTQFASRSGTNIGLNYRIFVFNFGAEVQSNGLRQTTVGDMSALITYDVQLPVYYGGILWRLGKMGIGARYAVAKSTIPKKSSLLDEDHPFEEKMASITLSYHFDGTRSAFFSSLFR